jgi:hypothetical protein
MKKYQTIALMPQSKKHGCTGILPVQKDQLISRRNLPHWQMPVRATGRSPLPQQINFVTFRTLNLELPQAAIMLDLDKSAIVRKWKKYI